MSTQFHELGIQGHFVLVKGFLMGFWSNYEGQFKYFFHRREGIKQETFTGLLKEYFEFDQIVYLCIEGDQVLDDFRQAIEKVSPIINLKIDTDRVIKNANFQFSFKVFDESRAEEIISLFDSREESIILVGYKPKEDIVEDAPTLSGYDPIHPYTFEGHGLAQGNFESVIDFFIRLKKSEVGNLILCSELELDYQDVKRET